MIYKNRLLKASSVCLYVFSAIWFVAAACAFALSDYICWLFLVFAFASLYDGFAISSLRERLNGLRFEGKDNIKFIICWVISVVCIPSLIINTVAYCSHKEDGYTITELAAQPALTQPKTKKPFYRRKNFITMCVSLVCIFVCSFSAMCFETSGFSVDVSNFTLTKAMTEQYNEGKINGEAYVMENDTTYSVTMYVPHTATEDNPAATVFVLPGFTRTKATMAQYCIELSRRGMVVFTLDPGGQGNTTETSTAGANGIEYLVQYVYNNTDDFRFCDKTRFGATGHSAGGGNVITLAADFAGNDYQSSIIKAVYNSGYIKTSATGKFKKLHCNAAMSYAYYDEGAFRYQTDTSSFEIAALQFINEVNGEDLGYEEVAIDYGYGSMDDGTYRIVHREKINHCFEMYDKTSIANTINFFDEALQVYSGMDGSEQIWFGKEFFNGLALAAAFTFVISLCCVLMGVPFFATIKQGKKKSDGVETEECEGTQAPSQLSEEAEPAAYVAENATYTAPSDQSAAAAKPKKYKSAFRKGVFWTSLILSAIIACLDYIPFANLTITWTELFPVSNSSSVYTYQFPARMINVILLWAVINGLIGLVLYFGIMLGENLYKYIRYKMKGITPDYDWSKIEPLKVHGNKWYGVILNVLKILLLAVIMYCSFFALVQINYWLFHQDFRFMLISASPLNARMFVTSWEYIPLIFVFYFSNAVRVNGSIAKQGWKEWKVLLVSALANSVGLGFILLINYFCYFTTGSPYYGYWGNGNEIWLFVNMVFALVVMMFILPIFNRILYKKTGSVWVGAIACCAIFVTMTICASVSYIPMY